MNIFRRIKYFWQRGKRGYSDEDIWDFHDYLCMIIPPVLRKIKEKGFGCPGDIYDETRVNDECWKWKKILEEISQGFEAAGQISNARYLTYIKSQKKGEQGFYTLKVDKKKEKLLAEKFDRGLDLFKTYFLNLWD